MNARMNGVFILKKFDDYTRTSYSRIIQDLGGLIDRVRFNEIERSLFSEEVCRSKDLYAYESQMVLMDLLNATLWVEPEEPIRFGPIVSILIDDDSAFKLSIHQSGIFEAAKWKKVMDILKPVLLEGTCVNFFSSEDGRHWRIFSEKDGAWKWQEGVVVFK